MVRPSMSRWKRRLKSRSPGRRRIRLLRTSTPFQHHVESRGRSGNNAHRAAVLDGRPGRLHGRSARAERGDLSAATTRPSVGQRPDRLNSGRSPFGYLCVVWHTHPWSRTQMFCSAFPSMLRQACCRVLKTLDPALGGRGQVQPDSPAYLAQAGTCTSRLVSPREDTPSGTPGHVW